MEYAHVNKGRDIRAIIREGISEPEPPGPLPRNGCLCVTPKELHFKARGIDSKKINDATLIVPNDTRGA